MVMKLNELQLAARLDEARSWIEDGKPLHAIQAYLRLITAQPKFLTAYIELSSLYVDMGRFDAAVKVLLRAKCNFPDGQEVTYLLGNVHMGAEEYDKALNYFKKLVDMKLPRVHFNMGVAFFCQGNIKRAEEQFRLTMKYDPRFPKINESLGELLLKRNAYAEAIFHLKKGIELDPYNAVSHHLLGMGYRSLFEWKNAYNEFVIAIEMDPQEAANWQLCGEMLMQLKRPDESEQYLRKALELQTESIETLILLSEVFAQKGNSPKAREFIERALRIDPKSSRAREVQWNIQYMDKRSLRQ